MATKKDSAVSFLRMAASGRARDACAKYVAVHSHVRQKPDERGAVVVHIFRFDGDRIAELWDVGQPVPAESVNATGMF